MPKASMKPDLERMFRTVNGHLTAADALGHREFVLTRLYESA